MPTFNRRKVLPSRQLIFQLAVRTFASWIPTGYRWFERAALGKDHELGKEIRAWSSIVADLRTAIEIQRYEVFLSSADGTSLRALGAALGFPIKTGETDDSYAKRIATELVTARITVDALEALVPALTNNQVGAALYEPWKDTIIWGEQWWGRYLNDERFYRGATFELQTNDTPPDDIDEVLSRTKAGGVLPWLARIISTNVDQNDDPLAAIVNGERQTFINSSVDVTIESFGTGFDYEAYALELPNNLEVYGIEMGMILTWGMGLTFNNLLSNYALSTDMLTSAQTGVPKHFTLVTTPFDVNAVTDVQPAPIIYYYIALDDGTALDASGALLG